MARPTPPPPEAGISRAERVLATMSVTIIGLSLLCFAVLLVAPVLGWTTAGNTFLTTVVVLPLIGLPIGFLLLIALLVLAATRRSREARGGR